jgi:hypothetical protein
MPGLPNDLAQMMLAKEIQKSARHLKVKSQARRELKQQRPKAIVQMPNLSEKLQEYIGLAS